MYIIFIYFAVMAYCEEYNPDTFSSSYKSDKILVAAIDFGTTFSGYAFSFKSWFETDPTKIVTNSTWVAGQKNLISLKTPTCVLLKPDKSFHSFGYAAEEKYAELALDDEHDSWYFFKRFKMSLYNNTVSNLIVFLTNNLCILLCYFKFNSNFRYILYISHMYVCFIILFVVYWGGRC